MGVIFLTLCIDLAGFSIVFPLFPAILEFYLAKEGEAGFLGWILLQLDSLARLAGAGQNFTPVLFGGFLGSIYSILQFAFAPVWGRISDRLGRRPILLVTIAGTALSYLIWVFSGSFLLFVIARLIGGIMSGNLSVATAAVADVTSRENRAKGMGLVGAAFGLGFIVGPALGGLTSSINLLDLRPQWAMFGITPFTVPAAIAFLLSTLNLVWVHRRFRETRLPQSRPEMPRIKNPLRGLAAAAAPDIRRANWVYFIFVLAFGGMEFTLTFLALERFGYSPVQMTAIFVYIGGLLIVTQGLLVRKAVPRFGEKPVLLCGLALVMSGLAALGLAGSVPGFYAALALLAVGSGLTNPSLSALVSLYSSADEQGRAMGTFRGLGSLARAIGPLVASALFWWFGSRTAYLAGAAALALPLFVGVRLPRPKK